jgi:hypothetical protein
VGEIGSPLAFIPTRSRSRAADERDSAWSEVRAFGNLLEQGRVIASEAKQSRIVRRPSLDCFVAALLAMTICRTNSRCAWR